MTCGCDSHAGCGCDDAQISHAATWGVRMAAARTGSSDFWFLAEAADLYTRSGGDRPADAIASPSASSRFSAARFAMEGPLLAAEGSRSPTIRVIDPPDASVFLQALIVPGVRSQLDRSSAIVQPPPDPFGFPIEAMPFLQVVAAPKQKKCCVKRFVYPKSLKKDVQKGEGAGKSAAVGFCFEVEAEFTNDENCDCSCCEFQQSIAINGKGPTKFHTSDYVDDYQTWSDSKGLHRHSPGRRTEADKTTTKSEEKVEGGVGSDREGNLKEKRPHGMDGKDNYSKDAAGKKSDQVAGCFYKMKDCPSIDVAQGDTFNLTYAFMGVIMDTCFNRIAAGPKFFAVKMSGGAGFGSVEAKYDGHRSDASGTPGEGLMDGEIVANPHGNVSPAGYHPPSESRSGRDY